MTELCRALSLAPFAPTLADPHSNSGVRHRTEEHESEPTQGVVLPPGARFGRYEILAKLGAGGMGSVFAAMDTVLERRVALKVLHRGLVSSSEAEAFALAEARAIAALAHPKVVAIYDAGVTDGCLFLSMELVDGVPLSRWLLHPRSKDEILRVMLDVADGLSAMHARGLIHRDIKPDNVLVTADGGAKITDFGLVRAPQVHAGAMVGTPAYMSPEQLFARPADARSDQFSFMVTLFEALSGARPYRGRSIDELRWAVTSGAVTPMPAVSGALRRVLTRGLATDPSLRFRDMHDLAAQLRAAATPREPIHLTFNKFFMVLMALMHVATVGGFFLREDSPEQAASTVSSSGDASRIDGALELFLYGLLIMGFVTIVWLPAGVVWAPLNAYGLFRRRPWARVSSIVYAAIGLFSCFGTMYSVYALYSLTRPSVKKAFEQE